MRISDDLFDIAATRRGEPEQAIRWALSEFAPKQPGDVGSAHDDSASTLRPDHGALSNDAVDPADQLRRQQCESGGGKIDAPVHNRN